MCKEQKQTNSEPSEHVKKTEEVLKEMEEFIDELFN